MSSGPSHTIEPPPITYTPTTMDVSGLLASNSKGRSTEIIKDIPLVIDAGLLAVFDPNDIDSQSYHADSEAYLLSTARDGVQALLNTLFALPHQKSPDGPLAILPPIETPLPRAKPLPKPKPLTKWEAFAKKKGIQKTVREKRVWDEEKQEWAGRWGRGGKNKEVEEQWITEVPANAPDDFDPAKEARDKRKTRVSKNEKQRLANQARAQGSHGPLTPAVSKDEKKGQLRSVALQTKMSTASMGRFDKKIEGEPKLRGIKRKFEPNEGSMDQEKNASLALVSKLDREGWSSSTKKPRRDGTHGGRNEQDGDRNENAGTDGLLNVRKAVRYASKGRGASAMVPRGDKKMRGGGRGGRGGGRGGKGKR